MSKPSFSQKRTVEVTREHRIEDVQGDHITLTTLESVSNGRRRTEYRKTRGKKNFVMLDLEAMIKLSLTQSQWKILSAYLSAMNIETGVSAPTQKEMVEMTGIARQNITSNVAQLVERRILFRIARGRYRVNAHVGFRGSLDDWTDAEMDDEEPVWKEPVSVKEEA